MAFTTVDLEALERAIADKTLSVSRGGREVRYRDMDELKDAYNLIKKELSKASRQSSGCHSPCMAVFDDG